MKKLAILCVLVMAISLVPAFAADANNTTTTQKNLKHQYKYKNTQKNCTDCDNDKNPKVNAKHQYKYKKGIKKTTDAKKSVTKAKNQSKYKYGLKDTNKTGKKSTAKKHQYKNTKKSQNKTSLKKCTGTCKA